MAAFKIRSETRQSTILPKYEYGKEGKHAGPTPVPVRVHSLALILKTVVDATTTPACLMKISIMIYAEYYSNTLAYNQIDPNLVWSIGDVAVILKLVSRIDIKSMSCEIVLMWMSQDFTAD